MVASIWTFSVCIHRGICASALAEKVSNWWKCQEGGGGTRVCNWHSRSVHPIKVRTDNTEFLCICCLLLRTMWHVFPRTLLVRLKCTGSRSVRICQWSSDCRSLYGSGKLDHEHGVPWERPTNPASPRVNFDPDRRFSHRLEPEN